MIGLYPDPRGRAPWLVRDAFDSPDGTPLSEHLPDLGGGWTVHALAPIVQGGKAQAAGAGNSIATLDAGDSQLSITATLTVNTSAGSAALVFWFIDTSNYYFATLDLGNQRVTILRYQAGALQELARLPSALVQGAPYEVHVEVAGRHVFMNVAGVGGLAFDNLPLEKASTRVGFRLVTNATMADLRVRRGHLPFPRVVASAANAPAPLVIPTYDGSGQATHPSVMHAPEGWGEDANGKAWRYWQAMTPYPASNNAYENPCVIVSDDGDDWVEPPGLTNPIAGKPEGGYNSDTELCLVDGVLHLLWRETDSAGTFDRIWAATTPDGVNFSAPLLVMQGARNELLSPSLVRVGGRWLLYVVNRTPTPTLRPHVTAFSAPALEGPWVEAPVGGLPNPPHATARPWHLSVLKDGDVLYMFLNDDQAKRAIWLGASHDGFHWTFGEAPLLTVGGAGAWDDNMLYRASGVRTPGGFDLWYSAQSVGNTWGIGRTSVTLL